MTKLSVQGMTCGHCERAVKEALEAVEGAQNVAVNLDEGYATVEGDANVDALVAAVKEEGYNAAVSQ
ncbi:MAG: cation transporter [Trueperaceae bacterium]|nr:cation transporter [Trueperaceae bacterium]